MEPRLHPTEIYRLPWTLNDNVLGWLEPTKRCNLYCEGCYSRNDPESDKSFEQIRAEMEAFVAQRKIDSISIAGGEPLIYPRIVDVVRMIAEDFRLKPILNTNGMALTPQLLRELRDAGLFGFTFHVDSGQKRPGWKDKNEVELNELRLHYARMVADAGDLSVAFNSTVYPHTIRYLPDLLDWAKDHIDIVASMVFILYRTMRSDEFEYFKGGEKIDMNWSVYHDQDRNPKPLEAHDALDVIGKRDPAFRPCAYLGGTKDPNSFKWLLTSRFGTRGHILGYAGPRYMEVVQNAHHAAFGKWIGYAKPSLLSHGRSVMAALSAVDPGTRKAMQAFAKRAALAPWKAAEKVYSQTTLIIQPIDMMPDGEMNMCDGCPDMTVRDGKLVWSCRLDELLQHGCFLTAYPKQGGAEAK